jgi:hypothetical protein
VNNLAAVLLAKFIPPESDPFEFGATVVALAAICAGLLVLRHELRERTATVLQ